jgi:hypothetical protein
VPLSRLLIRQLEPEERGKDQPQSRLIFSTSSSIIKTSLTRITWKAVKIGTSDAAMSLILSDTIDSLHRQEVGGIWISKKEQQFACLLQSPQKSSTPFLRTIVSQFSYQRTHAHDFDILGIFSKWRLRT